MIQNGKNINFINLFSNLTLHRAQVVFHMLSAGPKQSVKQQTNYNNKELEEREERNILTSERRKSNA